MPEETNVAQKKGELLQKLLDLKKEIDLLISRMKILEKNETSKTPEEYEKILSINQQLKILSTNINNTYTVAESYVFNNELLGEFESDINKNQGKLSTLNAEYQSIERLQKAIQPAEMSLSIPQQRPDEVQISDQKQPAENKENLIKKSENRQKQKSALIYGTIDQSSFYNDCKKKKFEIITKFHQSGPLGFLRQNNLFESDRGVCNFMSNDFACAVTGGRYVAWKNNMAQTDKAFIERLRTGQAGTTRVEAGEVLEPSHPAMLSRVQYNDDAVAMKEDKLSSFTQALYDKLQVDENATSCSEAPCVKLNVNWKRTGLAASNSLFSDGHAMMFTMAVDDKGQLDKAAILIMA